jgi:hypothetical protein
MSEQTSKRPIIFALHSLGGTIVKSVGGISEDMLIRLIDGHTMASSLRLSGDCRVRDEVGERAKRHERWR